MTDLHLSIPLARLMEKYPPKQKMLGWGTRRNILDVVVQRQAECYKS